LQYIYIANKITDKAERLFRHEEARLDIYWNGKIISPTTSIGNIIFKLVKWGHISDHTWQCIPQSCCLIPERVFYIFFLSYFAVNSLSWNISCIYIPKIIYLIFNGYKVFTNSGLFLCIILKVSKANWSHFRVLSEGNSEFVSYELCLIQCR